MTANSTRVLPLMHSQLGMRDGQRAQPENPSYNVAHVVWFEPVDDIAPDIVRLVEAVRCTVAETPCVTATMHVDADQAWTQIIDTGDTLEVGMVDLSDAPDPDNAFRDWARRVGDQPFPLIGGPLIRADVVLIDPTRIGVAFVAHHMVADGFGAGLFLTRLIQLYASMVRDQERPAPFFGDFAELVRSERLPTAEDIDYWASYLDALPSRLTFADAASPPAPDPLKGRFSIHRDDLHTAHSGLDQDLSCLVLGIVSAYVALLLDEDEAVLGVPLHNRRTAFERITPSMMMTELPLRTAVPVDATPGSLAISCRDALRRNHAHSSARPEDLFSVVPAAWRAGRMYGPTVNVYPFSNVHEYNGVRSTREMLSFGPVRDMSITVMTGEQTHLAVEIAANPLLYSETDLRSHVERLGNWMGQCLGAAPDRPVEEHRLLTAEELAAHGRLTGVRDRADPAPVSPRWGRRTSPAGLAGAAGITESVSGVQILDSRERPVRFGMVGRVRILGSDPQSTTTTDMLASLDADGITFRGHAAHRRQIRGRWVELDAVAVDIESHGDVSSASVDPDRHVIVVVPETTADHASIVDDVSPRLPRGVRVEFAHQ